MSSWVPKYSREPVQVRLGFGRPNGRPACDVGCEYRLDVQLSRRARGCCEGRAAAVVSAAAVGAAGADSGADLAGGGEESVAELAAAIEADPGNTAREVIRLEPGGGD